MDFNPNKPAKRKEFFWSTYIPDRNPKYKMHSQRGHALNALGSGRVGILYRWNLETETWDEVFRNEESHKVVEHCEHCNKEFKKYTYTRHWGPAAGEEYFVTYPETVWVDTTTNPRLLFVCRDCRKELK